MTKQLQKGQNPTAEGMIRGFNAFFAVKVTAYPWVMPVKAKSNKKCIEQDVQDKQDVFSPPQILS